MFQAVFVEETITRPAEWFIDWELQPPPALKHEPKKVMLLTYFFKLLNGWSWVDKRIPCGKRVVFWRKGISRAEI